MGHVTAGHYVPLGAPLADASAICDRASETLFDAIEGATGDDMQLLARLVGIAETVAEELRENAAKWRALLGDPEGAQ